MSKKGQIRLIPLQADLCLNKSKVDITDFTGWKACNAPVYGGCLSPLYKKEESFHDFYLGKDINGNAIPYNITNKKLLKNGVELMSWGSNALKKTKVNEDYSTLAVRDNNSILYIKETSSVSFVYNFNQTEQEVTITDCVRIIASKVFSKNGKEGGVVWYQQTDGNYNFCILRNNASTSVTQKALTNGFQLSVDSPLLQIGVVDDTVSGTVENPIKYIMVSAYGTSGVNLSDTNIYTMIYNDTNVYEIDEFEASEFTSRVYEITENKYSVSAKIVTESVTNEAAYLVPNYNNSLTQRLIISCDKPFDENVTIKLLNKDLTVATENCIDSSGQSVPMVLQAGQTSATFDIGIYTYTQVGAVSPIIENKGIIFTAWSNSQKEFPFVVSLTYNSDANPNDSSMQPSTVATVSYLKQGEGLNWQNSRYYYSTTSSSTGGNVSLSASKRPSDLNQIYSSRNNSCTIISTKLSKNDYSEMNNTDNPSIVIDVYTKDSAGELIKPLKQCNCVFDDGRLYTVDTLADIDVELPLSKVILLAGTFKGFTTNTRKINYEPISVMNIAYDVKGDNKFLKYYKGSNVSISNYYLRIVHEFSDSLGENTKIHNVIIDAENIANPNTKSMIFDGGVIYGTRVNNQGTCFNKDGWRLLFNNNFLFGISTYENEEYIGTLLTDWISIDNEWCPVFNESVLYYKDNSGVIWKIEKTTEPDWEYKIIENRYIVINTSDYFNCYDSKTDKKRHWASDYNNRVTYGYGSDTYTNNELFKSIFEQDTKTIILLASAQNANYEETGDALTSIELGALIYGNCLKDYISFVSCNVPYGALEGIDLYSSEYKDTSSTYALYEKSYQNNYVYINTDLVNPDAVYPIATDGNIRYTPSLFTEFIQTYNNKDMILSDGIAYKLLYFNNTIPIMAFYMLDGMEGLNNAFVLQSSYYGVSDNKIYTLNYNNGVSAEAICDITNMDFLGALPSKALFWSAQNRAIYSFAGNCLMQLLQYANDLEYINKKWFNTATQELFLDTNIGLLVFSDLGTYCLNNVHSVKDIYFYDKYFIVNIKNGDISRSVYMSYNPLEGYESNKVIFTTKFYGNNLYPLSVNNIYMRVYNQEDKNASGYIRLKAYTVTDVGYETDEKVIQIGDMEIEGETVTGEAWDEPTDTILLKYTPKYTRGLGFALECESEFPIVDIKFDYSDYGVSESQISHINI